MRSGRGVAAQRGRRSKAAPQSEQGSRDDHAFWTIDDCRMSDGRWFCIKMPACVQPGVCSTMPAGHLFNRACTRSTIVLDVFNQVEQVTGAVRWLALLLSAAAAALPVAKAQGLDAAVLAFNDAMRLRPDFARIRAQMYAVGLTISLPAAMCALMCDGFTNGICLNQLDPHPSTY